MAKAIVYDCSLCAVMLVAACGSSDALPDARPVYSDVRVPIPDPDPAFVDLITPEVTVAPGEDVIFCYYVDNPVGNFAADGATPMLGLGGHHIALRRAALRRPNGTLETCTSGSEQTALELGDFLFGGPPDLPTPAGWATNVAADVQFVIETHYQNATDLPLLARDVYRIHRIQAEEVVQWVDVMHLRTYDVTVPVGLSTLAFDCEVPTDLQLFEFWGHQHGYGIEQSVVRIDDGGEPTEMYRVRWGQDPVIVASFAAPMRITAGSLLRVTCTWNNTTNATITFPDEMCSFGGVVAPTPLSCSSGSFLP